MKAIFLDIETTGLDPLQHSPIDLALKVIDLNSGIVIGSYQSLVKYSQDVWENGDPVSLEINGYTWESTQSGKEIKVLEKEVIALFSDIHIQREEAFYICQNPGFDRAYFNHIVPVYTQEKLNWPYHWLDLASMYWVKMTEQWQKEQKPYPKKMILSKNAIAEHFSIPPEKRPHRAMNGVEHLIECYQAVLPF